MAEATPEEVRDAKCRTVFAAIARPVADVVNFTAAERDAIAAIHDACLERAERRLDVAFAEFWARAAGAYHERLQEPMEA